MCQQIVNFCSGIQRPLLYIISSVGLLASGWLIYLVFQISTLYVGTKSLHFGLILLGAICLGLMSLYSLYAARTDQKRSIQAKTSPEASEMILGKINDIWSMILEINRTNNITQQLAIVSSFGLAIIIAIFVFAHYSNGTEEYDNLNEVYTNLFKDYNKNNKTIDDIQSQYHCCGFNNKDQSKIEKNFPKSCCSPGPSANVSIVKGPDTNLSSTTPPAPIVQDPYCTEASRVWPDSCKAVLEHSFVLLSYTSGLLSMVVLFMLIVTILSAYKTHHYDEAEQNAYA